MSQEGKYKYLVIGAGRQGSAAIDDLLKHCEAKEIAVIEPDDHAIHKSSEKFQNNLNVSYFSDLKDLKQDIKYYDVMLCCTPAMFNLDYTKVAVKEGIPFCDLGGIPAIVKQQEDFVRQSKCSSAVVPECGVSPGLTNMIADFMSEKGDDVEIYCGGIPNQPVNNWMHHKYSFNLDGLISEYSGFAPVIQNGTVGTVESLSSVSKIIIDDVEYECSSTSNNSLQSISSLIGKVASYRYLTIRQLNHWSVMQDLKRNEGCFKGVPSRDEVFKKRVMEDSSCQYDKDNKHDKDRLILIVRVTNKKSPRSEHAEQYKIDLVGQQDFSAMELTTAWGITIVAHSLLRNKYSPIYRLPQVGFMMPDHVLDGTIDDNILTEVQKRLDNLKKE